MTRRHQALVGAALVAALVSTPTHARHRNNPASLPFDQHAVVPGSGANHFHDHHVRPRRRSPAAPPRPSSHVAGVNRDCLHHSARSLLDQLEARFGRVELVSTCRPGARMPSGDVSWHARNRAFDFKTRKGVDKRDVMVWLGKNSPGVTMSYRNMAHIHTDTGTFHKVIYNAASHQAGERAVAIWKQREATAKVASHETPALAPARATKPRLWRPPEPPVGSVLAAVEPTSEEYAVPPPPVMPAPIELRDRRDIFRRYVESRDVVVLPHTSLSCPNGRPFPNGLVRLLNDASAHFGRTAYVNSGYRTPERNRRVGGARNSEHMKCQAIDWRLAGVSIADLRRWVFARLPLYGVGGLGTYRTHLHTDGRKAVRLATWTGGTKKRVRYAKHRKPSRYAAAG